MTLSGTSSLTRSIRKRMLRASITVKWANGATETVPLDKFTGGVAHYTTTSNLDPR